LARWGARRVGKAQSRALQEWHSASQGAQVSTGEGKAQPQALQEWHSVGQGARASAGEGQVGLGRACWDAGAGLGPVVHTLAAARRVGTEPEQAAHRLAALDSSGPMSPVHSYYPKAPPKKAPVLAGPCCLTPPPGQVPAEVSLGPIDTYIHSGSVTQLRPLTCVATHAPSHTNRPRYGCIDWAAWSRSRRVVAWGNSSLSLRRRVRA